LYDIRKQKPTLTMEKGVFNEDFRQFVIRLGEKDPDGETIGDIMIEDQTNIGQVKFNQILADSGQMYTTDDKRFFVMNLFNGTQYQEPGSQSPGSNSNRKFPFIRTHFKSWSKVWDMKEFEMVRTDEGRFSQQRTALSMRQLRQNVDSLQVRISETAQMVVNDMVLNLNRKPVPPPPVQENKPAGPAAKPAGALPPGIFLLVQELEKPLGQYASLLETFRVRDRSSLLKEARTKHGLNRSIVETRKSQVEARRLDWVKTGYELYNKYSFAIICFVFLFIGAPLGAIIRKGGFGYPILVSIIFFVTFVFLAILCRKLAESYLMTPFWAAMTPCVILAVFGLYVTRKAMNDTQLFSTERLERFLFRMRNMRKAKTELNAT
jgi:lipopolysaccharide export system permease protein